MDIKKIRIIFFAGSFILIGLGFLSQNNNIKATVIGLIGLVLLGIFDRYTPVIAGLSEDNPKIKTMRRLNRFSMLFLVVFSILFTWFPELNNALSDEGGLLQLFLAAIIMIVIGNAAPKLPFNRHMGLRLPWTIRDEAVWRVAHKILGYVTFPLAVLMIIAGLIFDYEQIPVYFLLAWILIPSIYSLVYSLTKNNAKGA